MQQISAGAAMGSGASSTVRLAGMADDGPGVEPPGALRPCVQSGVELLKALRRADIRPATAVVLTADGASAHRRAQ